MVLKRSLSFDLNDTGEGNNQAGEDLLSRVTKKGKKGKGGKKLSLNLHRNLWIVNLWYM